METLLALYEQRETHFLGLVEMSVKIQTIPVSDGEALMKIFGKKFTSM